jgi:hypothetical protein
MIGDINHPLNPLETHGIYVEGNMENISETILIDIYKTPDVMNFFLLGHLFLHKRFVHIWPFLNIYVTCSLGLMMKCNNV